MAGPADDLRTRHIAFAVILTPYRRPTRGDGLKFVDGLSNKGVPDLSYRYDENPQRDGTTLPGIVLVGQEGRRKTEIRIDFLNGALRFFVNFLHPASADVAIREADAIYDLFFEQFGAGLDPQLVEARLAVDVPTKRASAMASLGQRFFGPDLLKQLGNVDFMSVSVNTAPEKKEARDALDNPSRQIKVEKLLEDPRRVFVETVSQWSKMIQHLTPDGSQPGSASVEVFPGPLTDSASLKKPSEYVEEAKAFIRDSVIPFIFAKRDEPG